MKPMRWDPEEKWQLGYFRRQQDSTILETGGEAAEYAEALRGGMVKTVAQFIIIINLIKQECRIKQTGKKQELEETL